LRPAPDDYPQFIAGAGASIATRQLMAGQGQVRFMMREEPREGVPDNGWRIFGDLDTDEHVADAANLVVVDFNQLCALEPALIGIWDLPVGTDLEIVRDDRIRIIDVRQNAEVPPELFYVPEQHRAQPGEQPG
jgi:hypothetical protein